MGVTKAREGGRREGELSTDEGDFSPIAGRTRRGMEHRDAERGEALQAPLRQAVGNDGPVTVKVPFSVTDLRFWEELAGRSLRGIGKGS